jgi:hypothetical protein
MHQSKILTPIKSSGEGPEDRMGFTMKEKQTLTREYAPQYRQADRKKKSGTKPGTLLKKHIPVRTHYPGNERKRAQALLADDNYTDEMIAGRVGMHCRGLEQPRERLVEEGFEVTVKGKPRGHRPRALPGEDEARLIALVCGPKPEGRSQEIQYTPKHRSWLNRAEIEINVLGQSVVVKKNTAFIHYWYSFSCYGLLAFFFYYFYFNTVVLIRLVLWGHGNLEDTVFEYRLDLILGVFIQGHIVLLFFNVLEFEPAFKVVDAFIHGTVYFGPLPGGIVIYFGGKHHVIPLKGQADVLFIKSRQGKLKDHAPVPGHIYIHGRVGVIGVIVDVFVKRPFGTKGPPPAKSVRSAAEFKIPVKFITEILSGFEDLVEDGTQIHVPFIAFHNRLLCIRGCGRPYGPAGLNGPSEERSFRQDIVSSL